MTLLIILLLVFALIFLILHGCGVPTSKYNLQSLGLALFVLSFLIKVLWP